MKYQVDLSCNPEVVVEIILGGKRPKMVKRETASINVIFGMDKPKRTMNLMVKDEVSKIVFAIYF